MQVAPENLRLAFIDAKRLEDGAAIRGAVLVTDAESKPIEFRCTNAVRPTPLQRLLYGEILDQYLLVELISLPLLRGVSSRLSLIAIRNPVLLHVRKHAEKAVALIQPQAESAGEASRGRVDDALIHSESGKFEPLVLTVNKEFPGDASVARPLLELIAKRCSPLEPFDRLQLALEQVHTHKRD